MSDELNENRDPITYSPAAHPVGTGVGAVVGGTAAGAALGLAGGPIGVAIGGVAGALVGGLSGSVAGEALNPTGEGDDVLGLLNRLLESCRDGEYGFTTSADHAQAPGLRVLLTRHAGDCAAAAALLEREILARGGEPDSGGTTAGALHRGWVAVRSALTSQDDRAVLQDCEAAQDTAVAGYRAALKQTLPTDLRTLIEEQALGARRNHDEIKALRDTLPG